jgi:predicted AlkP superfamily phosphohydrolase/phosphomutase
MIKRVRTFLLIPALILFFCVPAVAYVGPGAGFVFAGSFIMIFLAFLLAFFYFLTFPIRIIILFFKRLKIQEKAKFKRIIIIGFDGMDYHLLKTFMKQGEPFPNFKKLEKNGTFAPLFSTEPPVSPVAWSTFSTGVNPGKHNIFDFLTTDRKTYMPKLACSNIIPGKKTLKFGKYTIPISKPKIELMRKSKSFWKIVSDRGIFSSVLRVPFTFPPEKFYGLMLSGLGTPDLRGSQGSFSFYSDKEKASFDVSEGIMEEITKISESQYQGYLKGPGNPFRKGNPPIKVKFNLSIDKEKKSALFQIGKEVISLEIGKLSPWVKVDFKAGLIKISGLIQLVLEGIDPIQLYISPIHIDPEKPSMPISHPKILSVYLSKLLGSYATLGMAEDTSAVNEQLLSEEALLDQIYTYQKERETILFDILKKYKKGLVVQVFEATDRVQHMFWNYLKDPGASSKKATPNKKLKEAVLDSYKAMDDFLGKLLPKLEKSDLLMIVSDHGFNTVNREFHLNSWLLKEGYLVLKEGKTTSGKWYADVDWSKTKAYGQGLNGLFLNMKGREKHGTVSNGQEADNLKNELKEKLLNTIDIETKEKVMKAVYKREEIYKGPYTKNAADIVLGYNIGYKLAWESAVNYVGGDIFSNNKKKWSGDHCFTSQQIPGIFFCNKKAKEQNPTLADISPTVLKAFGINPPSFIDGKDLEVSS